MLGMPDRLRKLVEAAGRAGYKLAVFIDGSQQSAEADEKWRDRRIRDEM